VLALIVVVGAAELAITWLALHPNVSDNYRAYYIDQTTTCLDKPVSGQYVIGSTVSFMPDDQTSARKLRVCGWDGPAGDGTHSVGTASMLRFAVPEVVPDGLVLSMMLAAIAAPDQRDQHIVLTGNGLPLGEAIIPDSTQRLLEFPVSAEMLAAGAGQLDITISYPTATEMTPRDSLTHYRSIKLMSVQLRRSGDRPSQGPQDDPAALRHHAPPDGPQGLRPGQAA
jgi:hypothetical protein